MNQNGYGFDEITKAIYNIYFLIVYHYCLNVQMREKV